MQHPNQYTTIVGSHFRRPVAEGGLGLKGAKLLAYSRIWTLSRGNWCAIPIAELAKWAGVAERQVIAVLAELQAAKLVERRKVGREAMYRTPKGASYTGDQVSIQHWMLQPGCGANDLLVLGYIYALPTKCYWGRAEKLAAELGIGPATVYRTLSTLVAAGALIRAEEAERDADGDPITRTQRYKCKDGTWAVRKYVRHYTTYTVSKAYLDKVAAAAKPESTEPAKTAKLAKPQAPKQRLREREFCSPTVAEVAAECVAHGYVIDAAVWHQRMEGKHWYDGGWPIANWRAQLAGDNARYVEEYVPDLCDMAYRMRSVGYVLEREVARAEDWRDETRGMTLEERREAGRKRALHDCKYGRYGQYWGGVGED